MNKLISIPFFIIFVIPGRAQNVGIGTINPLNQLHVSTKGNKVLLIENTQLLNTDTTTGLFFKTGNGPFPYTGAIKTIGQNSSESRLGLYTYASGTSSGLIERLSILDNGNVGIGIKTPSSLLHINDVYGTQDAPSANLILSRVWNSTTDTRASSIFHYYSTTTQNDNLAFAVSGEGGATGIPNSISQIKMMIQANGNVGIGTIIPSAKFEVAGGIKISDSINIGGQVRIMSGLPGAGKLLTSDSSGLASWSAPSVPDAQPTIQIGSQKWTKYNLDVAFYRNGDPISQVTDPTTWAALTTGAWCYINNDSTQSSKFGKLYNWHAVNDPRGLAPQGWHVPSDAEWTTLETILGGSTVAGGKMKDAGTLNWTTPNIGGNNNSGWAGMPGGNRTSSGSFFTFGGFASCWSSTEGNPTSALSRTLSSNNGLLSRTNINKGYGFSVRCLRD